MTVFFLTACPLRLFLDLVEDQHGAVYTVVGKTGGERGRRLPLKGRSFAHFTE